MAHRVTAAAVQVQVGARVFARFRGDLLPEGVDEAVVDRLVRKGLVEKVKDEAPRRGRKSAAEKPADEAPADAPAGEKPADDE